jgi:acetyltransferase-like isoleucine patch superfamily enzyme
MIVLPTSLRRLMARRVRDWDIHPTAYIGRSVILVRSLSMGPGARIGQRNVIRGLEELRLGEGARIAARNQIIGIPLSEDLFPKSPNRKPSLILGRGAMITTAHEIDCADRVELGDYATLAGVRSQILTHSLNLVKDYFEASPVEIGERSAVMSGCILQCGTRVPARCIVSAGSVVTTKLTRELAFYRGNPAELVRELPPNLGMFRHGIADAAGPNGQPSDVQA